MARTQLVCIVDDSVDYHFILRKIFKRSLPTYQVLLFTNGRTFLDELPQLGQKPDLVVLDRHMPKLDGHQVLLNLKQNLAYRRIPVVMMSADASPVEINSCYEAGANSFLFKEVGFDLLKEKLFSVCQYWLELNQGSE